MGKHKINTEYKNKTQIHIEKTTTVGPSFHHEGNTDKRFPEQDYTSCSYSNDALVVLGRQPNRALPPTLLNGADLLELPFLRLFAYYTFDDKTLK